MISGLDHVQVAMPAGREDDARRFYCGLLGLQEIEKPAPLSVRGGLWVALPDRRQLHLGVDPEFIPARKAHPALVVSELDAFARKVAAAGCIVNWDTGLPGIRRFYSEDPFGNRLEFVAAAEE